MYIVWTNEQVARPFSSQSHNALSFSIAESFIVITSTRERELVRPTPWNGTRITHCLSITGTHKAVNALYCHFNSVDGNQGCESLPFSTPA